MFLDRRWEQVGCSQCRLRVSPFSTLLICNWSERQCGIPMDFVYFCMTLSFQNHRHDLLAACFWFEWPGWGGNRCVASVLQLDERTGPQSDTPTTAGPSYKTTNTCNMFSTCSKLKCVFGTMYVGFFLLNECWKDKLLTHLPKQSSVQIDFIVTFDKAIRRRSWRRHNPQLCTLGGGWHCVWNIVRTDWGTCLAQNLKDESLLALSALFWVWRVHVTWYVDSRMDVSGIRSSRTLRFPCAGNPN